MLREYRTPDRLTRMFLISTYLTLGLACACLVYAEWGLMPEISVFAVIIGMLLVVAYRAEGRWTLTIRRANVLGAAIAVLAVIWVGFQSLRPSTALLRSIPWPTSMLPYLGPLVMILLPAKLLRPKATADFWGVQGTGLACVGLGCALADDAVFAALMLLYMLGGLWCLSLFLLYREAIRGFEGQTVSRLPSARQVGGWALPIMALAAVVFLYTPRSGSIWQVTAAGRQRMEAGNTDDPLIDLNRSGTLDLNRDVAFEVYAEYPDGQPKFDLSPEQRWRGAVFRYYGGGRWSNTPPPSSSEGSTPNHRVRFEPVNAREGHDTLPDFGPGQYFLTFHLKDKLRTPYLADPIQLHESKHLPVIQLLSNGRIGKWLPSADGLFTPVQQLQPGKGVYRQATLPAVEPDLGPEYPALQVQMLRDRPPLPSLPNWTLDLLRQLAERQWIPAEALVNVDSVDNDISPRFHEAIARALERYLSSSGVYRYSLSLERENKAVDPVEDFLYYTKTGHCNRFATALAMMLRSVRIPCQIVLGYRGADSRGDGWYDVRQCHAHSWVDVFVVRYDQQSPQDAALGNFGRRRWRTLSLDPTPFDEAVGAAAEGNSWWNSSAWNGEQLFRDLVLNYSPERREKLYQLVEDTATAGWKAFRKQASAQTPAGARMRTGLLLAAGIAILSPVAFLLWWQVRRRRRLRFMPAALPATLFHRRLLSILARRGWTAIPAQTPREFAETVVVGLGRLADGEQHIDFVRHCVELFYRVRFGQMDLDPDESHRIDDGLRRLTAALARSGN